MWPFKKKAYGLYVVPSPISFPVLCPWPSVESLAIYNKAIACFEKYRDSGKHPYVALVISHHWASQGYYVEFKKEDLTHNPLDYLLDEYIKDTPKSNQQPEQAKDH